MQNATLDIDYTNPMMFDQNEVIRQYEDNVRKMGLELDEVKKWRSIYTTYFNNTFSIKEGRRVAADKGSPNPNINMLGFAVQKLGLRYVLEPLKKHPRDFWMVGRIKVELTDSAGRPTHKTIKNKKQLLNAIADQIPEALVQFEDILTAQKETLNAKREQMLKMKAQMEGKDPNSLEALQVKAISE